MNAIIIQSESCASVMEVSVGGYYSWRKRLTKPPSMRRKTLKQLVANCYWENRKRYGTRRIRADLPQIRSQNRTFSDSWIDEGRRLKGNPAKEFQATNN